MTTCSAMNALCSEWPKRHRIQSWECTETRAISMVTSAERQSSPPLRQGGQGGSGQDVTSPFIIRRIFRQPRQKRHTLASGVSAWNTASANSRIADLPSWSEPARICDDSQCLNPFPGGLFMLRSLVFVGLITLIVAGSEQISHAQFAGVGGVYIDPNGMLRETSTLAAGDLRAKLETAFSGAKPSGQVSTASPLRKISLRRLEQALAALRETGESPPADMRFLAGLNSIKYVLIYPEAGDVVLAGPADAWQQLPSGDIVGRRSNRPVLQLDDLVTALRYAFANQAVDGFMGCSLEPTEQGVKAHSTYVQRLAGMDGSQIPQVIQGMEQAMGPQDIHVYGVARGSR